MHRYIYTRSVIIVDFVDTLIHFLRTFVCRILWKVNDLVAATLSSLLLTISYLFDWLIRKLGP